MTTETKAVKTADPKPTKHEIIEAKSRAMRSFLGSDQVQRALLAVLDDELRTRRFCRVLLTTCLANPDILDCTQESVFGSIMEAAQLNLEIDGVLGQAYLVPFKNNRAGTKEAVLIPGYKGLLTLVRRSGECKLESVECVYKGDSFRYAKGTSPFIEHVPNETEFTDERITHAYAIFRHSDGSPTFNVWTIAQIHAHKKRYARGWDKPDSAWQTSLPAMARKTVIRDTINSGRVPVSVEVQRLTMREAKVEAEAVADSRRIRSVDWGAIGAVEQPSLPAPSEEGSKPNGTTSVVTNEDFRELDLPPDAMESLRSAVVTCDEERVKEIIREGKENADQDEKLAERFDVAGVRALAEIQRKKPAKQKELV